MTHTFARRAGLGALLSLALAAPAVAGAQIIRVPTTREPLLWVSGGVGFVQQGAGIVDGATGSAWAFDGGLQYRGALELTVGRGTTAGMVGTWSRLPLDYQPAAAGRRRAKAAVSTVAATARAGGGQGLHQVIEIAAGAMRFADFRDDGGGTLPPTSDTDPMLAFGYGFGFPLGARAAVTLVQDGTFVLHSGGGRSSTTTFLTTRLSVRAGLGTRRGGGL